MRKWACVSDGEGTCHIESHCGGQPSHRVDIVNRSTGERALLGTYSSAGDANTIANWFGVTGLIHAEVSPLAG
jgi:hypothetical protein